MPDRALILELLQAKRCALWPDCACHETLAHWQRMLPTFG
jgi:hypothetical protein